MRKKYNITLYNIKYYYCLVCGALLEKVRVVRTLGRPTKRRAARLGDSSYCYNIIRVHVNAPQANANKYLLTIIAIIIIFITIFDYRITCTRTVYQQHGAADAIEKRLLP